MKNNLVDIMMMISLVFLAGVVHAAGDKYDDIVIPRWHVLSVTDGDTFKIMLPGTIRVFGDSMPVRILNFDTPELSSQCRDPQIKSLEKELAKDAKDWLTKTLTDATRIDLREVGRGSFFRLNARVYVNGIILDDYIPKDAEWYAGSDALINWCYYLEARQ